MATISRHRANGKKQSKRLWAMARARQTLNLKRRGEPLIPESVLKKLAALNLPEANQFVYQACLEKLLRGV